MLHEDAPTNSVGTGKETSLPPSSEPGRKLRKKNLSQVKSMLDIKLESAQQFPFLVEVPGIGNFIMSGSSPLEVRFNLRKIIQPTVTDTKVRITRLNQGEAIKYYMNRTNKSMKGIYEETMEIQEQMPMQQPAGSAEKRAAAQNAQKAKQLQQQKSQVQKQMASKEMGAQKTAMQNTMKAKMDDMKKRQAAQAAMQKKSGGTSPTTGV